MPRKNERETGLSILTSRISSGQKGQQKTRSGTNFPCRSRRTGQTVNMFGPTLCALAWPGHKQEKNRAQERCPLDDSIGYWLENIPCRLG